MSPALTVRTQRSDGTASRKPASTRTGPLPKTRDTHGVAVRGDLGKEGVDGQLGGIEVKEAEAGGELGEGGWQEATEHEHRLRR